MGQSESRHVRDIRSLLDTNQYCADCFGPLSNKLDYSSFIHAQPAIIIHFGIIVCSKCAAAHEALYKNTTNVVAPTTHVVTLDDVIRRCRRVGNEKSNELYEHKLRLFDRPPYLTHFGSLQRKFFNTRDDYIFKKYALRRWHRDGRINPTRPPPDNKVEPLASYRVTDAPGDAADHDVHAISLQSVLAADGVYRGECSKRCGLVTLAHKVTRAHKSSSLERRNSAISYAVPRLSSSAMRSQSFTLSSSTTLQPIHTTDEPQTAPGKS